MCDTRGNTVDDVHHLCADDVAYQDGLALHVNYNILGQIVSMAHVPFENCRLEEEDDDGVISHIVVHPDWRGKKTRGGKAVKVTIETIEVFPVFNPSPDVVQLQIQAAGGIEFYKGQILYISRAGRNAYPLPLVDVVLTDMSTDEGLSNVNNRNVRNNFLTAGMLITKRGQGSSTVDGDKDGASSDDGFTEEFEKLQGDTNSLKIMQVEIETDEDKPEFVPFKTNNYDKEFTATTKAVTDNIYAALNQETFGRLRSGSIGFTGDLANDVKREYCEQVAKQQRMLSRAYRAIFSHWEPNTIPYTGAGDAAIEPLVENLLPTMRHLIEPCDVDKYARPCDMDDEMIARAIEEAELLDIKPKLGDERSMRLLTHVQFAVLLNGGEYTDEVQEPAAFRRSAADAGILRLGAPRQNECKPFDTLRLRAEARRIFTGDRIPRAANGVQRRFRHR